MCGQFNILIYAALLHFDKGHVRYDTFIQYLDDIQNLLVAVCQFDYQGYYQADGIVSTVASTTSCLNLCSANQDCRAVMYNDVTGSCRIMTSETAINGRVGSDNVVMYRLLYCVII